MAPYARVFNLTTQRYVKPGQARGWVNDGVCVWVHAGVSIRSLTLAEMVGARSKLSEAPFPHVELRGLVTVGIDDVHRELNVAWQGTLFAVPSIVKEMVAAMEARA